MLGYYWEQLCEITPNWDDMSFKEFQFPAPVFMFVFHQNSIILKIMMKGHPRITCAAYFQIWSGFQQDCLFVVKF